MPAIYWSVGTSSRFSRLGVKKPSGRRPVSVALLTDKVYSNNAQILFHNLDSGLVSGLHKMPANTGHINDIHFFSIGLLRYLPDADAVFFGQLFFD